MRAIFIQESDTIMQPCGKHLTFAKEAKQNKTHCPCHYAQQQASSAGGPFGGPDSLQRVGPPPDTDSMTTAVIPPRTAGTKNHYLS